MTKLINNLGVTLLVVIGSLMCAQYYVPKAQALGLYLVQLRFLKENHKWIATAPAASFDPLSSYTFANTTTGKNRVASFRVTNGGNDTLQNYSTTASGTGFSKYSSPSGNITAGSYADVKFRFAPTEAGAATGSIVWTAPNMTTVTFDLHGTGIASGDTCTGGLLFSWHMETTDVTTGTPAGCSVGATTLTLNSLATITATDYYDGTHSLDCPTSSDYAQVAVSSEDIIKPSTVGTAIIYVKIGTFLSGMALWSIQVDANNTIYVSLNGTDDATGREVKLWYTGSGTARSAATTAADMALGTWYKVTAKWSQTAVSGHYLSISVNDASEVFGTTALGAWAGTLTALKIGDGRNVNGAIKLDALKIYDSWL